MGGSQGRFFADEWTRIVSKTVADVVDFDMMSKVLPALFQILASLRIDFNETEQNRVDSVIKSQLA